MRRSSANVLMTARTIIVSIGVAAFLWISGCQSNRPPDQSDPRRVAAAFCQAIFQEDLGTALAYTHPEMRSEWEKVLASRPKGMPKEPDIRVEVRPDGLRAHARILNLEPQPYDLDLKFDDGKWWVMK